MTAADRRADGAAYCVHMNEIEFVQRNEHGIQCDFFARANRTTKEPENAGKGLINISMDPNLTQTHETSQTFWRIFYTF